MTGAPTVAVVGGGIAGLAAAWELTEAGARAVVLEASDRLGGKIGAGEIGGRLVELGPDAVVARRPEAVELCREIGLHDLVPPGAREAYLWSKGRLRPLPAGLALGVPTRLGPLASAGIVSPRGLGLVAAELSSPPWRRPARAGGDSAIGPLLAERAGPEVVEQLADPLIGGIHAGSVTTMSAAAVFPPLLAAAQRRGSLLRNLRAVAGPAQPGAPVFLSPAGGVSALVERLSEVLAERAAVLHTGTPVRSLSRRRGGGWLIETGEAGAGDIETDGLVVAVPAPAASALVEDVDGELAGLLGEVRHASVALATLRFAREHVGSTLAGTGYLVPRTGDALLTACTWLSSKWPRLDRPDDVLIRVSAGRDGDDRPMDMDDHALLARAVAELEPALELSGAPLEWRVARFPDGFPQYDVGHLDRVAAMERAATRSGLALAGSTFRGVGIPACIGSGRAAARAALALAANAVRP